jgi:hypothetical protein
VTLDTDSLASVALRDLGREIEELVPPGRPAERVETRSLAAGHISQHASPLSGPLTRQKMTPNLVR